MQVVGEAACVLFWNNTAVCVTRLCECGLTDGDILVVRELRKLSNEARRAGLITARTADDSLKWLDWPQYVRVRTRQPGHGWPSNPMPHPPHACCTPV